MSASHDFQTVFERLRAILKPYESQLNIKQDTDEHYYLEGHYSQKFKRNLFFGSAQIKKNYVSFYLMPVYMYPEMLENISPALKKRMQGKSCFNFKKIDEPLFEELEGLTEDGFTRFQNEK
ncbi:MAG: hypothetical protein Kow002_04430 [Anaerolineales bacterium]